MLSIHRSSLPHPRRGFTLLELMLALMLLGLFVALLSPLLLASARERRTAVQEQLALQLAANQLERLTLADSSELDQYATATAVPVPENIARWMPEVEQTVQTTATDAGRRIVVTLTWHQRAGVPHRPVVLEGWSFAAGGQP
jgi:prepilin-type N-terminal cleavage/methylation domain-containing protein